jgi:hypothetical protein
MNARLQEEVLIFKRRRDYLFTDISYVRVYVLFMDTIRQAAKIGRRVNDHLVAVEDKSVQVDRH